ncbi:hypothetical protein AB9F39_37150, partial [Rhizobium leguminosarum]|uniref:hypothetical protein n=1 Tax=Rhizobium leguminosarum TaxID=384 RepID=UPI003F9A426E
AHVRDPTRKIHPNAGPRPNHAASTARITCIRTLGATELSKRRVRPQLKKKGLLSVSSSAFFITVDLNAVQNDALN